MNKHRKRACALLAAGLVLICAALGIHLVQQKQDQIAGETAALLLQQLERNRTPAAEPQIPEDESVDSQLPPRQYLGYPLIGSIVIPSVNIRLPVLNDWDEAMLKVAPCRYRGSISGGDLILMGHNYKSHFTPLRSVQVGAEVAFTNTEGKVFRYRVAAVEKLHRDWGEQLTSQYPLTIFTCTPGGIYRFVVRCEAIET